MPQAAKQKMLRLWVKQNGPIPRKIAIVSAFSGVCFFAKERDEPRAASVNFFLWQHSRLSGWSTAVLTSVT